MTRSIAQGMEEAVGSRGAEVGDAKKEEVLCGLSTGEDGEGKQLKKKKKEMEKLKKFEGKKEKH